MPGNGLFVYSTFDVLKVQQDGKNVAADKVDAAVLSSVTENAKAFAQKYELDGVLLDHYYLASSGNGHCLCVIFKHWRRHGF